MPKRLSLTAVGVIVALTLVVGTSAIAAPTGKPPEVSRARLATRTAAEFYAPRGLGMECGVYVTGVHCQSMRIRPYFAQVAEMRPGGGVTFCSTHRLNPNTCDLGNAGERAPTLRYGQHVTAGGFRCVILHTGIKCTVISSGKGFILTRTSLKGVGGVVPRPAPLHLEDFLSPDGMVWCGMGEGRAFCGTGLVNMRQSFPAALAELEPSGKVTICFIAHEGEAPLLHGAAEGCLQNWDEKAPILRNGQQSELDGVLCTSASNAITCRVLAGTGKGKGFRVNKDEAVQIGP